jgi:hypothetical protein
MRREPDFFGDQELVLVYVARRLRDALAIEKIFNGCVLDYALETAPYQSGLLFRSTKVGAFFYVTPEVGERARALLLECGYKAYDAPVPLITD